MKITIHELTKISVMTIILTILDSFYLTMSEPHFKHIVSNIQGSPLVLDMLPTILCYIVLLFGLYYFIIREKRSYIDAGILGLVIYAVFDFTNKAIFDDWAWITVFMDTIWGGILYALTTYIVYKLYGTN
jgi:uncharacterized membrane protein